MNPVETFISFDPMQSSVTLCQTMWAYLEVPSYPIFCLFSCISKMLRHGRYGSLSKYAVENAKKHSKLRPLNKDRNAFYGVKLDVSDTDDGGE